MPQSAKWIDDLTAEDAKALADKVFQARPVGIGDLPVAKLQRQLEQNWLPSAGVLIQPGSVTPDLLSAPGVEAGDSRRWVLTPQAAFTVPPLAGLGLVDTTVPVPGNFSLAGSTSWTPYVAFATLASGDRLNWAYQFADNTHITIRVATDATGGTGNTVTVVYQIQIVY